MLAIMSLKHIIKQDIKKSIIIMQNYLFFLFFFPIAIRLLNHNAFSS